MQLICAACGFKSIIDSEESGGVLQCARCGKRVRWGTPPEVEAVIAEDSLEAGDNIGFSFPMSPGLPYRVIKPVQGKKRENRKWVASLVVALAISMLAVIVMVGSRVLQPAETPVVAWDRAHRGELLELKSNADAMAMAGKSKEAYQQYHLVLSMVADEEVKDPVALEVVAGARVGEDRMLGLMVALPTAIAPTFPPPATPEIAAVTPPMSQPQTLESLTLMTTQPATAPIGLIAEAPRSATTQATAGVTLPLDASQTAADNAPPLPGPPPRPTLHSYTLADAVTDEQIGQAINKAVAFLGGSFRNGEVTLGPPGRFNPVKGAAKDSVASDLDNPSDLGDLPPQQQQQPGSINIPTGGFSAPWTTAFSTPGIDALCVYALLQGGRATDVPGVGPDDPFTEQILGVLKQYTMIYTYHRSLRAAALAVFNRTQDTAALEDDVRWLVAASRGGAYTYTMPPPSMGLNTGWDNSNSQYGLLGVWSGAQAGKMVPKNYWQDVANHWNGCANSDGTWNYGMTGASTTTMTCAGIASMLVARDYLDLSGTMGNSSPTIDAGLRWLDDGDNCMSNLPGTGMAGAGYGLYGLERVGLASGFKYFGKHDWYSELARHLVNEQHLDGSWGNVPGKEHLIDTSYALLFLARGRHPILFNKLRYDGNWNNRPRDVSHLARYAAHELERPLNWQVVNLRRNWFDWLDCPVLYISGNQGLEITQQDYKALRQFSEGGGLIFTHADEGSPAFHQWVESLVRTIFPKYELTQVPRDHPVYSIVYPIKDPPPLLSVTNGSRLLLIDSPTDLSGGWQLDWKDEKKSAFQLGINLFVYAAGKRNFKNPLASTYIPPVPDAPESVRQVTRLQYNSEWDPEPYAWERFARFFQWETHQAIQTHTVPMQKLMPGSTPIAMLTGTVRYDFTPEEVAAVTAYVEAGGVLMIDACGGQSAFRKSIEATLLPQAFPGVTVAPIGANHPLLVASRQYADDLTHPLLRDYAIENGGRDLPIEAFAFGKGWVIFSRLDVTTGLLGTSSWGILGFDPAYAQAVMKNAVLWSWARYPGTK